MRIARRLQELPPYPFAEISRLKSKAIAEGVDLLDFGIGDPDLPTPPHIVDALCAAAHDPTTHQYDETGTGTPEFRRAVADYCSDRYGFDCDPKSEILRLIGSKDGIAHLSWALVDPRDIVLVPDPGYAVYKTGATFVGATPYTLPLAPDRGYLPDLDAIPVETAQRARVLWLNYPNNPLAATANEAFFERVVAFAGKYDIIVAHDFAYAEVAFDGYRPVSFLSVSGAKEVGIEFHSLSKSYRMTGWRVGFAVGNPEIIAALAKVKSNVDSGVFLAVQRAAVAALTGPQECIAEMRAVYQKRRDLFVDGMAEIGWKIPRPAATFYVWAPIPPGFDNGQEVATALLKECGILCTPGSAYGQGGDQFVRFSLTVQGGQAEEKIREACRRIRTKIL
ncbi:MAG TPA: LL-diaminopimelate aminotransferase [Armatimonadota bacterium]|nr:LL-diaminopimelate aminotransferase [Armatimonadota bacterium]